MSVMLALVCVTGLALLQILSTIKTEHVNKKPFI
ncbi:hypothetical protein VAE115_321014 [Vibrio aestuarianus]|uniref:Uncharacterized protein n=1 Tax=Vibrio aestuarianus TaxID=28171 RepID=A0ABN8TSZ5_9VIBR|nr:hypothetical protein VAEU17_230010 [Vibrio aestuarianus]CAH8204729.1 hypothetical protein VAE032_271011 [Vibrio aestuarianus]CAH8204819.1 hypothetical protein VAE128_461017 [Vibrio aestuarianus]CAH8205432.1 hypothetical protein VAE115_321014 [Vibrio aestuarianus]CAH8218817.1 hypothetical protein VAE122_2980009 [Vibrio aestuarianus]